MPIFNLRKKKLKEISFFDLSQKAKKRKVWIFQSKMHLLADWLLWKIAKLEAKLKPSRIISNQPYLTLWLEFTISSQEVLPSNSIQISFR